MRTATHPSIQITHRHSPVEHQRSSGSNHRTVRAARGVDLRAVCRLRSIHSTIAGEAQRWRSRRWSSSRRAEKIDRVRVVELLHCSALVKLARFTFEIQTEAAACKKKGTERV